MARLVCTHSNEVEQVFAIKEGVNRVGRCADTTITLFDKACSRAHAEIYRKGDSVSIEDLGSRHGTFVNGRRITHRVRLHIGDRVDIGHTILRFSEGEGTGINVKPPVPAAAAPGAEAKTQEFSAPLAAELDPAKQPQPPQKGTLFRRLFGGSESTGDGEGGGGAADPGATADSAGPEETADSVRPPDDTTGAGSRR